MTYNLYLNLSYNHLSYEVYMYYVNDRYNAGVGCNDSIHIFYLLATWLPMCFYKEVS